MNSWTGVGVVSQQPVKRQAGNSTVLTLNLCVKDSWKDKTTGEMREKKFYIDVKVWGDRGDVLYEQVQNGDRVLVVGQLETESWDSKTSGKKEYKTVCRANGVDLLTGGAPAAPRAAVATEPAAEPEDLYSGSGGDIPF